MSLLQTNVKTLALNDTFVEEKLQSFMYIMHTAKSQTDGFSRLNRRHDSNDLGTYCNTQLIHNIQKILV